MNKKLGLAVAGALVAFSSVANAGITIPAGDWTIDIGGNVNAYYTNTRYSGDLFKKGAAAGSLGTKTANEVSTGLLPSAIGFGGKTRQNDLDIAFQFTFFTGIDANGAGSGSAASAGAQGNSLNIRQAYMTFGDASWGTIKGGRDLGVFGSDAILSDMTLLGVGTGAGGAGSSTLGRIGSGYLYADWVGQFAYTSPNFNGFQVTAAIREPWANTTNHDLGFEGKATYDFAANDVTGRVWLGGITQDVTGGATAGDTLKAEAIEVGGKVSYAGAQLVGYYYDGKNIGTSAIILDGVTPASGLFLGAGAKDVDVSGGYVQGTFVIPGVGTKLGASWGESLSKSTAANSVESKNESWIIGAYHPLTKSLNLVAEYTDTKFENFAPANGTAGNGKARTAALGAILFF